MQNFLLSSPLGLLSIKLDAEHLIWLSFGQSPLNYELTLNPLAKEIDRQLQLYFQRKLYKFEIPMLLQGTLFQKTVWHALCEIPYGMTISYEELAIAIQNPRAQRAVGNANGKNPIAIIIPCHRVIRKNKTMGGYSSGKNIKEFLLGLEKNIQ